MSANAETVATAVENTAEKAQTAASNTIEAITEAVKNASITPKTEAKQDTSEADAAHAASAAEGRRLYIGNLAYSTTDEQLKEFFTGFSIESTSIPTNPRTGRAVGYAFVDLTTKEEADRAIAELSGKEVQERKVSVQLARKPGSTGNGVKKEVEEAPAQEGEQTQQSKRGRGGFRGRARGRGGRGGAKRGARSDNSSGDDEKAIPPSSQVLPLVESTNVKTEATGSTGAGEDDGSAASGFKGKKKRGPPENGIPSSTKIMVANLPYELSEEKLKELFAEYQPESAKIALRPIPRYMVRKLQARGEPRKGRGFGFVNLGSEEMQKKAVEEMNGKIVDGREIAVKVAIDVSIQMVPSLASQLTLTFTPVSDRHRRQGERW
ncbi:hypothetical protein BDD12DRAFT_726771 [Trichophaea hybrida]|nr:hypothetical protein BDD12DRAFT_726771 [Trichophaea hybrida]